MNYTNELPILTRWHGGAHLTRRSANFRFGLRQQLGRYEHRTSQFDGSFELTDTLILDFGLAQTEVDNYTAGSNVQRNTWGQNQASAFGSVADLVVPATLESSIQSFLVVMR